MRGSFQIWRGFVFHPLLALLAGAFLLGGCGQSSDSNSQATTTSALNPKPKPVPGPGEKLCFACNGEGTVKCTAPGCDNGIADCPGPCLKLSKGVWVRRDVYGKPTDLLWQYFTSADGRGTYGWSQHHVGDVIVMQNGTPTDIGKCKICGGSGKVTCPVCKGTGKVTCPICNGHGVVPVAWTPMDNPYFNSLPDVIRLADGRVVLGRVAAENGDEKTIITRDKQILHVKASDILPREGTNNIAPDAPSI